MLVFTTKLVGINFRPEEVKELVKALEPGDVLALEREPDNPYDPNAIRVLDADENFLGFVAAKNALHVASEIAPYMDNGHNTRVTVIEGGTSYSPALRIEVDEPELD